MLRPNKRMLIKMKNEKHSPTCQVCQFTAKSEQELHKQFDIAGPLWDDPLVDFPRFNEQQKPRNLINIMREYVMPLYKREEGAAEGKFENLEGSENLYLTLSKALKEKV